MRPENQHRPFSRIAVISALIVIVFVVTYQPFLAAELVSKKYQFKKDTWLELGASVKSITLKSIKFNMPSSVKGKYLSISESAKAEVVVENKSDQNQQVGVAVALFDSAGNLVGVGSGGSKMFFKVKAGSASDFTISFSYVTEMIEDASSFQITLELR